MSGADKEGLIAAASSTTLCSVCCTLLVQSYMAGNKPMMRFSCLVEIWHSRGTELSAVKGTPIHRTKTSSKISTAERMRSVQLLA